MTHSGSSDLLYDNINEAAADLAQMMIDTLRETGGVHAPTTLATAGMVIGETLFRASGIDMAALVPGTLIDHAWLTNNCLRLVQMLQDWFGRHQVVIADLPSTFARFGSALTPHQKPAELVINLRIPMTEIFDRHQIGSEERVLATALAATRLTLSAYDIIHPSIGAAVVVDALVIGARMVPLINPGTKVAPGLSFCHRIHDTQPDIQAV